MNPHTRLCLAALPLLLATSCSITPIVLDAPPPSGPKASLNGNAEIVVVRPEGFAGWMSGFGIYINDQHVGSLGLTDYVRHEVAPGVVRMFAGAETRSPARFPVEANRVYYFKAYTVSGWWFARVQLEVYQDPAEGRAAQEACDDATYPEPRPFPFELDLEP